MDVNRLSIGVLGLGSYFHNAYLSNLGDPASPFHVAAICQRNRSAMEETARKLGDPALYTSWHEFLAHPGMEAVLISTPHHLHYDQVHAALEQGLHVLVDKPLCLDAVRAEELVRLARRYDRVLSVAYNYHYWPCLQSARLWIASGKLGRVTSASVLGTAKREGSPILDPNSWYHEPAQSGGGSMVSGGTHRLEAILWLIDSRPRSVFALMQGPSPDLDLQAGLVLELEDGVVVTLLNETEAPARWLVISIFGEHGALFIRDQELEVVGADSKRVAVRLLPEADALSDFHAAIVRGKPLLASGENGYWAVAGIQAAYASARSRQPQRVRQPNFD